MIECVRRTSRNVKRWQSGEMALRWTAAGMLEAERQFRRIIGYRDLAKLAIAIEHDLATQRAPHTTKEPAIVLSAWPSNRDRRREVPRRVGHPPAAAKAVRPAQALEEGAAVLVTAEPAIELDECPRVIAASARRARSDGRQSRTTLRLGPDVTNWHQPDTPLVGFSLSLQT